MKKFNRFNILKNSGLTMFRTAIENLQKSSELMERRMQKNNEKVEKLTNESDELNISKSENERIVINIKKIIGEDINI
jgi:predicted phage tail protein